MAMGGVYPTGDITHGTMGLDSEAPVYRRGKQIMTVSTFVREINDLRIATTNSKKAAGLMLPTVRLHNDTDAQINLKIRKLKRHSRNRIFDSSSSEDELDSETARVDHFNQKEEEGNSSTKAPDCLTAQNSPPTKPTDQRSSSRTASESEIWDNYSSESDLPDLTEDADPSYSDRSLKIGKEKSRGLPPENIKRKKKRQKHSMTGQGSGSGELMKAARKDCMKKMKIYSATPGKDKRIWKESNGNNTNNLPLHEQMSDNTSVATSSSLGRMTGLVQLKPNAKSPKDVERESDKIPLQNKELKNLIDNGAQPLQSPNSEQERVRIILKNRLTLLTKKSLNNNSQNSSSEEVVNVEDMSGNESEETITYEADNKEQNDEILSEIPGSSKRKSVFICEANKKLRIEADKAIDSVIENDCGEGLIKIQNVTGGVHEAFSPLPKQLDETEISQEQPNISANLEILKTELELKEKRRGVISEHIKLIQKELADLTKQLKGIDDSIEDIKKQIKDTEKSPRSPSKNKEPISSVNEELPPLSSKDDSSKGVSVISDASIIKFAVKNPTTKAKSTSALPNAIPSAPGNVSKPPQQSYQILANMRKHPNPTAAPANPAPIISVTPSTGGGGLNKIVGANSQGQVSLQQSLANVQHQGPPPSYAKAVQGKASSPQTSSNMQKLAHPPSYTSAVQGQVLGAQQAQFQMQPSLPLRPQIPVQMRVCLPQESVMSNPQLQQLQLQPGSQRPTLCQPLPVQMLNVVQQQQQPYVQQWLQQSNLQTPSHLQQMHQQLNLQTPSQVQQMQLPFNQPHSQAQIHPQVNTPGMLRPSLNPSSLAPETQIMFLQQPQSEQGIILVPNSAASSILLSSAPPASTVATSAVQSSSTTTSSITGVIPSALQGPVHARNLEKDKASANIIRSPFMNNILRRMNTYRPGPKSKTQGSLLPERNIAFKQNPQTSLLPFDSTPVDASPYRGIPITPLDNNSGAVNTTAPPQMAKPAAKSHLMVVAQPSVKGGVTAQAKLQPVMPIITKTDHNEVATSAPSQGEIEDYTSSPEAENSCFLCGSPDTFVCCNNIVYCSKECKEKDWSRHKSECTNKSNS